MLKFIALGFVSLVAAPVAAQAPAVQTAAAATGKAQNPDRIVCERQEVVGSRLGGTKVCKTAREWEESRRQAQDQIDDWQRRLPALPKPGDPG